jgi:hypothetical protein
VAADVIRIGIDQLPDALRRGEEQFARALSRGLRLGAERGRTIMVKRTPTDLGQLRASWKVKATALVAELINDAPHAGIVELGARPHKVSAEGWQAIYEWVRRHPELYGRTRMRRRVSATLAQQTAIGPFAGIDPEITGITWAIVKKINKHGQKPTFFVMKAMDDLRAALIGEVETQLARATARQVTRPKGGQ